MAPWWIVAPALAAVAAAAILALRNAAAWPLPTADSPALGSVARRTAAFRIGLVAAIGGTLAAVYLIAPRPAGELSDLVVSGRNTMVVVDVSRSISDLVYREVARTLEGIVTAAGGTGRVGLVLFSDSALEALPPGSPASELVPFIRYFRPRHERGTVAKTAYSRTTGLVERIGTQYPLSPWWALFSGGTRISTGLRVARVALERDQVPGRVILLSDLDNADDDLPGLTRELVAYEQNPLLELRVVALPPSTAVQQSIFRRITGDRNLVVSSLALATGNQRAGEPAGGIAWPFAAAVAVLALVLAANEALGTPLRWRPTVRETPA
jgi:hypothetical protein